MSEPTIESIEQDGWPGLDEGATDLVRRVHALRRTPVADLSPDDLRVLLGQRVGVAVVLPIALERVAADPLLEGDYYPGDVLNALLGLGREFWGEHPVERARLVDVIGSLDRTDPSFPAGTDLATRIEDFLAG
jgi:hypothetical protein